MARHIKAEFSLTETRQFRRLVEFAEEVADYALESGDAGLGALVDELRTDLLEQRADTDAH